MEMEKCKVCGHELKSSDTFCPKCGFEIHILPNPVSDEIVKYEEERVNNYRKRRDEYERKEKDFVSSRDELEKQLREYTDAETKTANIRAIDGFVRIVNINDNSETILPVYHGVNTYGFEESDSSNHHKINIRVRGLKLNCKLFSIEKNNEGRMIVRPIGDVNMMCEGIAIPKEGKYAEKYQPIFINNNLKVFISTF